MAGSVKPEAGVLAALEANKVKRDAAQKEQSQREPEEVASRILKFVSSDMEEETRFNSTIIDAALAKGLDQEGLLKLKAVEFTIQILKGRDLTGVETIEKVLNIILKQIK